MTMDLQIETIFNWQLPALKCFKKPKLLVKHTVKGVLSSATLETYHKHSQEGMWQELSLQEASDEHSFQIPLAPKTERKWDFRAITNANVVEFGLIALMTKRKHSRKTITHQQFQNYKIYSKKQKKKETIEL